MGKRKKIKRKRRTCSWSPKPDRQNRMERKKEKRKESWTVVYSCGGHEF